MKLKDLFEIISCSLELEIWDEDNRVGVFNATDSGCIKYVFRKIAEISISSIPNRLIIYLEEEEN